LRTVSARPEIARCLAGLGRVAMDLSMLELAREHLSESIRISQQTGARIGVARGLVAFAALAMAEQHPELAVRLTAAATALRQAAGLPGPAGSHTERYLAAARHLGEPAVAQLWTQGLAMSSDAAVALALDAVAPSAEEVVSGPVAPACAPPGALTSREREIVALVASGLSNRAIAAELYISPATAARHVANIFAKLGFKSRSQIAAWAAGQHAQYPRR
jgi:DNA-binding CsgD family transcriptional regulator